MRVANIIADKLTSFFKREIVCEQYPMLSSISRFMLKADEAIGVVFMLHHICEKDPMRIPTNEDLKVSPSFLEKIILKYKKGGFDFVSLDRLYEIATGGDIPSKPFVVFTIDDGYLDNYTNALPIFEKYNVPFAIFVATDFVDKRAILWWDSIDTFSPDDPATVGDFLGGLYILIGGGSNDPEGCREVLASYGLISADQDLDAELSEGLLCDILAALGAGMTTDDPAAAVTRADLADLFMQLMQE